jgi:aspartyl-tRNA(Asn)/glutamyl-tRNA(Gln) amidotransferase subunit A
MNMNMNRRLTIRTAARLLDSGAVSSVELSSFCHSLAVAGENVWGLNAFEGVVGRGDILDRAKSSDDRRRLNESLSIFDGIPISVKANIAVADQPLTAGSQILGMGRPDVPPCGYNADVVRRLVEDSGSVLIGMTSMDEFGMGSLGNTSSHSNGTRRLTKNPLPLLHKLSQVADGSSPFVGRLDDPDLTRMIQLPHDEILEIHHRAKGIESSEEEIYSAGGSSCGSAASVAHGSSLLSLGTDTGGSVRLPSAWCGLVGLKPSYGLLSRHGVVSYASSFDTVGVLAKSVDCAASALEVLAQRGETSRDSTFSALPADRTIEIDGIEEDRPLAGMRIGIPAAFSVEEIPSAIREAWSRTAEALHQQGAVVKEISTSEISPKLVQNALAAYYVLVSAEASSNLSRYDGFRYGTSAQPGHNSAVSGLTPLEQQYSATRTQGFGTEVARRILCGTSVLSSDRFHSHYEAAAKLRAVLAHQLHTTLSTEVDALLVPTALSFPSRLDQEQVDSTEMFANDIMTIPASLAGLPVLSMPVEMDPENGEETVFKAGMSLVGSRLMEGNILKIGKALEMATAG